MEHKQCKRPPCVLIVSVLFLRLIAEKVRGKRPGLAETLIAAANRTSAAKAEGGGNCVLHEQKQTACTADQRKEEGCAAGAKSGFTFSRSAAWLAFSFLPNRATLVRASHWSSFGSDRT